jgi:hypothetical protein
MLLATADETRLMSRVTVSCLVLPSQAVVEELDRQGLLEAVINLGSIPTRWPWPFKAADLDVGPAKRSPPL